MRVLYLSAEAELGGAERSLLDILASMRRTQPSWPLHLVSAADGPLVRHASDLGVSTLVLPFGNAIARLGESGATGARGFSALAAKAAWAALPAALYAARLRRVSRIIAPDIVHTNNVKMHVLGARARLSTAALVWHLHDFIGSRRLTARLLRSSADRVSAVVANSDSVAEDARAALGTHVPIVMVHNGVDLERFSGAGDRVDLDRVSGLPPAAAGVVRVGLVATFGRWKGHTTFLDAMASLPRDLPVRGYVIGGAVYRTDNSQYSIEDLRRHAAERGLADRVGFTGFLDRPENALRSLDVVVHASTSPEPFGLVIAEAMACGRAVIASNAGGAREIFTAGVDALVHAPGDSGDLAARIIELVRDPQARQRMGLAGRATAERRFDRARLAADLVPVYRKVAHA